jgi:hypothetical protein
METLQQFLRSDRQAARVARVLLVLGCVAFLVGELLVQIHPRPYVFFPDFQDDYNAALALHHGLNPLEPAATWARTAHASADQGAAVGGIFYAYAPIFALVQMPLTLLPLYPAYVVWCVCSLIFLVVSVYACLRVAGLRPSPLYLLLLATAIGLMSIVRLEFVVGNVDIFLLFLVCTSFWAHSSRRTALGAVLLGLACVTKPVLLPFIVFLLWKREFRFALMTVVAFAVLLLAPYAVLGGRALRDLPDIWRYWSNENAPYLNGYAPKNVLARLFNPNPYVQPVINVPALTTIFWLAVVLVVVVITAAVISPRRLAADARTLFEIGLVATAVLLVSPLTEITYMFLLVIPLLGCYCCLRAADWRTPGLRFVAGGTAFVWLLLCTMAKLPIPWVSGTSVASRLYYSLIPEALPLYLMIAFFALQLRLLHVLTGLSTAGAIRQLVRTAPALAKQWVVDASTAFRGVNSCIIRQFQEAQVSRVR